MRSLLLVSFLFLYLNSNAQLPYERLYGEPNRSQQAKAVAVLDDERTVLLFERNAGPLGNSGLYWLIYAPDGATFTEHAYRLPIQYLYPVSVQAEDDALTILAHRRRSPAAPGDYGPLWLYRFALDGTLLEERRLTVVSTARITTARVQRTADGGRLIATFSSTDNNFRLYRTAPGGTVTWSRDYQDNSTGIPANPLDRITLLERADGGSIATTRLGTRHAVYAHTAAGTLEWGSALDGTGDYPLTTGVSASRALPDGNGAALYGVFENAQGEWGPGALHLDFNGMVTELTQYIGDGSDASMAGLVIPKEDLGYYALIRSNSRTYLADLSAFWLLNGSENTPERSALTEKITALAPSGRHAYFSNRAAGGGVNLSNLLVKPAQTALFQRVIRGEASGTEEGKRILAHPDGGLVVIGWRSVSAVERRIWVLWLDREGRLLRERTIDERPFDTPYAAAVDPQGNLYISTEETWLIKLDPEGELLWQRGDVGNSLPLRRNNFIIPDAEQVFFFNDYRILAVDPADGTTQTIVAPLSGYRLEQWCLRSDQLVLVYRGLGDDSGELLLRTVTYDGELLDERSHRPFAVASTLNVWDAYTYLDTVRLVVGHDPSGSLVLPDTIVELTLTPDLEPVRQEFIQMMRGPLYASTGSGKVREFYQTFQIRRRTRTADMIYEPADGYRFNDVLTLTDGSSVATGTAQNGSNTDLYVGFTQIPGPEVPDTEATLTVFPNPSNGYFQWQLRDATRGVLNWQLTDAVGRRLLAGRVNKETDRYQTSLTFRPEAAGIFYLHVQIADRSYTTPVVVR